MSPDPRGLSTIKAGEKAHPRLDPADESREQSDNNNNKSEKKKVMGVIRETRRNTLTSDEQADSLHHLLDE